jgi:beta-glucosidase
MFCFENNRCGRLSVVVSCILTLWLSTHGWAQITPLPASEVNRRVDALLGAMTTAEKIKLLGGTEGMYTTPLPRLGIPALRMSDGPVGVHVFGPTTAYPAGIALAASWNTDLARRVGQSMGDDARARGVNILLGPGLNIYRAPMAGRNFEYQGEDPYLASRIVVPLVEGLQGRGVVATLKHFAGNNQEYDRQKVSSDIDERTLREIYLPAFEAAVKEAKAGAIMDGYNLFNGTYMTANAHLNNEIVKREWGFDGIIMSDWTAAHDAVAAANGGLDLEMPSAVYFTAANLLPALKDGRVSMATIDDKVRRILRTAIEFGFFDHPQMNTSIPLYNQHSREVALEEARESMVLLKNEGHVLPLDKKKIKTIAVLGPNAYPAVWGGGGSSHVDPFNAVSYLEGLSHYLGNDVRVLSAPEDVTIDDVIHTKFRVTPDGPPGLKAEFFNNRDLHGKPALTRTDEAINFDWGEGSYSKSGGADPFSVRWTGYFVPPVSTAYKFYVAPNDGARLYVNDQLVVDDTGTHSTNLVFYTAPLQEGVACKIRLEYVKNARTAAVRFGIVAAERPTLVGSGGKPMGVRATEAASKADAVILCVGFSPSLEGEASDRSFRLPGDQEELVRQISAVNKNVIVVLTAGGNVDMTKWIDRVPGLVHAWYPGEQGGLALAQLLFGDYSPSGKLPVSFERRWEDSAVYDTYYPKSGERRVEYKEGVFLGYRHFDRAEVKPLFPFGFGLSYTTFAYSNLEITPVAGDLSSPVTVSFDVKNTGPVAGSEVAELYVGNAHASVPRPVKELKGFSKVPLQPGETRRVTVTLDRRAFSFYDVKLPGWKAEPGTFGILVGSSSAQIELKGSFSLQ